MTIATPAAPIPKGPALPRTRARICGSPKPGGGGGWTPGKGTTTPGGRGGIGTGTGSTGTGTGKAGRPGKPRPKSSGGAVGSGIIAGGGNWGRGKTNRGRRRLSSPFGTSLAPHLAKFRHVALRGGATFYEARWLAAASSACTALRCRSSSSGSAFLSRRSLFSCLSARRRTLHQCLYRGYLRRESSETTRRDERFFDGHFVTSANL
jgi:hypothetical protein